MSLDNGASIHPHAISYSVVAVTLLSRNKPRCLSPFAFRRLEFFVSTTHAIYTVSNNECDSDSGYVYLSNQFGDRSNGNGSA